MSFVRFADTGEIPPGRRKTMRIGLRHIAVFNVEGRLYAIEDACAHMKAPLSAGRMRGTQITCTRHGWTYDVTTGLRVGREAGCVRTYPVKIEAGAIFVDTAASESAAREDAAELEDDLPPLP